MFTGQKNISPFAYCEMSNIFTRPTHFLPVIAWVSFTYNINYKKQLTN